MHGPPNLEGWEDFQGDSSKELLESWACRLKVLKSYKGIWYPKHSVRNC